jgi:hypothetical protein
LAKPRVRALQVRPDQVLDGLAGLDEQLDGQFVDGERALEMTSQQHGDRVVGRQVADGRDQHRLAHQMREPEVGEHFVVGVVCGEHAVLRDAPRVAVGRRVDLAAGRVLSTLDGERPQRPAAARHAERDHRRVHVLRRLRVLSVVQFGHQLVVDPVDPAGRHRRRQVVTGEVREAGEMLGGERELARNAAELDQPRGIGSGDHAFGEVFVGFEPFHHRRRLP